jgi:L-lactate utilization protein LutC
VTEEPGGREHGDRAAFLAPARQRLAGGIASNPVHAPPASPGPGDPVPAPRYLTVDPDDLVGTFVRSVEDTAAHCHVVEGNVDGEIPAELLDRLVAELAELGQPGDPHVVVSDEPAAQTVGRQLADRGVTVHPPTPEAAATAALGVTSAVAGIAATGSLVLDSRRVGARSASLLPPVHLCVLGVNNLLQTPGDVLRGVGSAGDALPSSLVLVTGPSRTGDIEQLITLGAHGPTALHVVLLT